MKRLALLLSAAALAVSCSTTKVLPEGTYRLTTNNIEILNNDGYNASDLEPYIKQQANSGILWGWNPFLYIYNWSNGKDNGWDRFVKKIGEKPIQFDPSLIESSKDNMEAHLRYQGYYGSTVTDSITYKKRRAKVTYRVTLGKKFPIKEICYDIPDSTIRSITLADTLKSHVRVGSHLSESSLESESQRLSALYRHNGYYGFSKNHLFFEADTTMYRDSALLTISVREYTRNESPSDARKHRQYYINNVSITHPQDLKIRQSALKRFNRIYPGDMYDEQIINNTYSRFSGVSLFSSVNINLNEVDTNKIDCHISLTKSKMQSMKLNMEVSSNSNGLIGISPSLSYSNRNIFRGGETFTIGFMGNFQFKFNNPIRSNELGVSAGLSFPKFIFLPDRLFKGTVPRSDINLSYNYQSRPEYTRNIISTSFSYNWNNNKGVFYTVSPLQLNIIRLFNLDEKFYAGLSNNPFLQSAYQNHFDLGLGGTIYYTTNTAVSPKTSYFYTRLQVDLAGHLLSLFNPLMPTDASGSHMIWNTPYSQFSKIELNLVKTWVFGKNNAHSIATRLMGGVGLSYGNSEALPFEKQFYAGGSSSLRGWASKALGPGMSMPNTNFIIPNQTGDVKLEANIEYRFKMFWKLAGAIFADAGNIWNLRATFPGDPGELRADTFFKSIAFDWGVGIRLDFDFVLLRLDLGIKTYDPRLLYSVIESPYQTRSGNVAVEPHMHQRGWISPQHWFERNNFSIHFGVGYPF